MNAWIRFIVWGVMPIGGLAAGLLATGIGVVSTIVVGCVGSLLAGIPVIFSKLWRMRKLPTEMGAVPEGSRPTEPLSYICGKLVSCRNSPRCRRWRLTCRGA